MGETKRQFLTRAPWRAGGLALLLSGCADPKKTWEEARTEYLAAFEQNDRARVGSWSDLQRWRFEIDAKTEPDKVIELYKLHLLAEAGEVGSLGLGQTYERIVKPGLSQLMDHFYLKAVGKPIEDEKRRDIFVAQLEMLQDVFERLDEQVTRRRMDDIGDIEFPAHVSPASRLYNQGRTPGNYHGPERNAIMRTLATAKRETAFTNVAYQEAIEALVKPDADRWVLVTNYRRVQKPR